MLIGTWTHMGSGSGWSDSLGLVQVHMCWMRQSGVCMMLCVCSSRQYRTPELSMGAVTLRCKWQRHIPVLLPADCTWSNIIAYDLLVHHAYAA